MPIPERFLDELTERNDIVDVVGQYVRLTKKSGSNLFGLCPFHSEKTPSFSVSPDKQIYHCFGCGKGGGVISFIMEIENLSFQDAVAFLARRANMPMPEEAETEGTSRRKKLLELNREAARFFHAQLIGPQGGPGQAYVERRGINMTTVGFDQLALLTLDRIFLLGDDADIDRLKRNADWLKLPAVKQGNVTELPLEPYLAMGYSCIGADVMLSDIETMLKAKG